MRKFFFLFMVLAISTVATAQNQQGYVKTKGRLDNNGSMIPGTRLSGAMITVKGRNAVVSGNNGQFTLAIPGSTFYLQNVQKQGYVIADPDILSKQYSYSSNPLILVLETQEQQTDDKLQIERKIRRTLQRQLQQREDEIEALKDENKITTQKYQELLQQLYAEQESNERLISDMAERYSKIDYDQMDDFNRLVSECILNGELLKADSLLNTKGDINKRTEALKQLQKHNSQEESELAKRKEALDKNKELAYKELADLAQDCYNKFEIFKMQHMNDSAAYYIELRSSLDTLNVKWMLDFGEFVQSYFADYDKAMQIYKRALNIAYETEGTDSHMAAECHNDMGTIYHAQANYQEALKQLQEALTINTKIFGDRHESIALAYNNIGSTYYEMGDYDKAMDNHVKSLEIYTAMYGEDNKDVARCYSQIGTVYEQRADFEHAQESYGKSLDIYHRLTKEEQIDVATVKMNLCSMYYALGQYDNSIDYCKQALDIYLKHLGKQHPLTASAYNNLGVINYTIGHEKEGLDNILEALNIYRIIDGDNHPNVATAYSTLSVIYNGMGQHEKALEMVQMSIRIYENIFGTSHLNLAIPYINQASIYESLGLYDDALELAEKSLAINLSQLGEKHHQVSVCQIIIGEVYVKQGKYLEAFDRFEQCFMIDSDNELYDKDLQHIGKLMKETMSEASSLPQETKDALIQKYNSIHNNYARYFDE